MGSDRTMLKIGKGRPDVRFEAGISRARRAIQPGNVEQRDLSQPVEIKPRVQLIRAGQPFGPKRNLVFASVHDARAAGQRRLRVIVHVLGRTAGVEMKDMIRGIVRVNDDLTAMIADDAPGCGAVFERTVLNQFSRR